MVQGWGQVHFHWEAWLQSLNRTAIKNNTAVGYQLIEEVEIFKVSGHDRKSKFACLQIDQRVIQTFALSTSRIASEPEQQASENARGAPSIHIRRRQTVWWNIKDRLADNLQSALRPPIGRIEPAKGMRQFRKANSRVVTGPIGDEGV